MFSIGALLKNCSKHCLVYKFPFTSGIAHPCTTTLVLEGLLNIPLYKELNVQIHPIWRSLFAVRLQSKIENDIFEDDFANQDNFKEEIKNVFTQTMVHNF